MSDDFDINKFLDESFAKFENKITKKIKKVPKPEGKAFPVPVQENKPMVDLSKYQYDRYIDDKIYEKINISTLGNNNIPLEGVIKPLMPNEKVFNSEFTSDKIFLLDKFIGGPKKELERETKIPKVKDSQIIKQLKSDSNLNYSSLLPMNYIWMEYINTLLNNTSNIEVFGNKMIKADLHGAIIKVDQAKNKTLVGNEGIVLLETKRSFNIINKDNEIKTLLKRGAIFRIDLPNQGKSITLVGDNLLYKAVERTKVKFKNKYIFYYLATLV